MWGCSRLPYQSSWSNRPVTIDGKSGEWNLPLAHRDEALRLNYSINNDEKNLYVCIRTSDQATQLTMLQAGFSFSIDTSGRKQQLVSIGYPVRQMQQLRRKRDNEQQPGRDQGNESQIRQNQGQQRQISRQDLNQIKNQLLDQQDHMMLSGFRRLSDGLHPLNESGIAVAMDFDSAGVMVYEARIPFSAFYKDHLVPADTLKTWSFTMTINGMEAPAGGGRQGGMGGGPRMGMGIGIGGPGMRVGGSIPIGGSGSRRAMIQPRSSWNYLKLSLSGKQ